MKPQFQEPPPAREAGNEAWADWWARKCAHYGKDPLDALVEALDESEHEELESVTRQNCYTNHDSGITTSLCLSANAAALRRLAELGRFRIVEERGRCVAGYWPEDDPEHRS